MADSIQNEQLCSYVCNGLSQLILSVTQPIKAKKGEADFEHEKKRNNGMEDEDSDEEDSDDENPEEELTEKQISDRNVLSGYAKQFLPALFNIFAVTSKGKADSVFRAISLFIKITETNFLNNLFKTVMSKLLKNETQKFGMFDSSYYLNLTVAFVPALDETNLEFLWKVIHPNLQVCTLKTKTKLIFSSSGKQRHQTKRKIMEDFSRNG